MTALVLAMILDALAGEPRLLWERWPHPAVLGGRAVALLDERLNHGDARAWGGLLALVVLVAGAGALGLALMWLPGVWAEVIVVAVLVAQRSLSDHVRAVADALDVSLGSGRMAVARIVGRETAVMDESAVARAAIESGAENLSDGVVAPVFWFVVAGLPGILIYKIVNTADSMIGHRTPRHREFGRAAARFDDALNWIPARLAALMIWCVSPQLWHRGFWGAVRADARRHASPNAGWPEAAMARALGVALSGPRAYQGQMRDDPFVNADGQHRIGAHEIRQAVRMLWQVWGVMLGVAVLGAGF